jgi:hypothetical protein
MGTCRYPYLIILFLMEIAREATLLWYYILIKEYKEHVQTTKRQRKKRRKQVNPNLAAGGNW